MVYRTRDEMLKVLGENLRASRLADNLSQQTAAERSGISLKAIRLAPPEINDAMFERRFAQKGRRQRAGRTPREATHG